MAAYPDHAPYPMDSSYPPHQSSRNDDPYNSPPAHYMDPQRTVNHTTSSSFNTKPRNSFDLESVDGTERPLTSPPPSANPSSTRGWLASFLPKSIPCRLYILIVVIETAIDLAIEGDILVRFSDIARNTDGDGGTFTRLPVYLGIFALAHVFQLALAIDAVHARNTLQFAFLAVFNALILAYAVIQIFEVDEVIAAETGITHIPIRVLTRIIPAVISLAQVAYIALGWQIWKEFGWKVYKFLGADRAVKRMYGQFQFFECLVKFDVFFWVGFSVQLIFVVLDRNDWEYYLTIAALPISILLLIEGHLAARHENKFMMVSFMAGCLAASAYFAYKLFRIWEGVNTQYYTVRKSLTIFAAVSILLLITTFVNALIVMRNFGHGLKEAMSRKKKGSPLAPRRRPSAGGDQAFSEFAMSDARKRMTID